MSADLNIRQICFVIQIDLSGSDNSVNLVPTLRLDIRVQSQVHQNPFQGTTDCLPTSFDQKKVTISTYDSSPDIFNQTVRSIRLFITANVKFCENTLNQMFAKQNVYSMYSSKTYC